jgi:hypothetical protein
VPMPVRPGASLHGWPRCRGETNVVGVPEMGEMTREDVFVFGVELKFTDL